jgi:hypothetical protein
MLMTTSPRVSTADGTCKFDTQFYASQFWCQFDPQIPAQPFESLRSALWRNPHGFRGLARLCALMHDRFSRIMSPLL